MHFGYRGFFKGGRQTDASVCIYKQSSQSFYIPLLPPPHLSLPLSLRRLLDGALIKVAAWRGVFGRVAVFCSPQMQQQPQLSPSKPSKNKTQMSTAGYIIIWIYIGFCVCVCVCGGVMFTFKLCKHLSHTCALINMVL